MLNKIKITECWIALGLCIILSITINTSYSSQLEEERIKHSSGEPFISVLATMHKYDKYEEVRYRDTDDDGHYTEDRTIKYNITYAYVVKNKVYYMTLYDKTSLDGSIHIYYNPKNPQQTSFFATYEDAVEGFQFSKIIGNIFILLSVLLGCFTIFRTFIYKTPDELGGVVVKDDFSSFDKERDYDDYLDQEEMFENYGVVATDDFGYVSPVKRYNSVIPDQGDKPDVDRVETIAFPGKTTTKERFVLYTEDEYKDINNN